MSKTRIAVAIAEGNSMAGRLLSDYIKRQSDFDVVCCVGDIPSLLHSVRQSKPAVALVSSDLREGPLSGLAALRELRELDPKLRPILMFDRPDARLVLESLRAGARGLFSRSNFDFAALRKCIRCVCLGQLWIANAELEYVFAALTDVQPLRVASPEGLNLLTKREEDVMRLVAEGLGNREIAQNLQLSEHTVKNYLFHIFDKLGISSRVELVLYAVSNPRRSAITPAQDARPLQNDTSRGSQV